MSIVSLVSTSAGMWFAMNLSCFNVFRPGLYDDVVETSTDEPATVGNSNVSLIS